MTNSVALPAIPPFPKIATQVLQALEDPSVPMDRIIKLVEKDIALTTATLKTANSGFYGRKHRIGSIPVAIRTLGMTTFSHIITRASVKHYIGKSMPREQLNRCWGHSLACAEISKSLADAVGLSPDAAYSAGLLHDIGRFGLALAMPEKFAKLNEASSYVNMLEAEQSVFGFDHTEFGRMMAEEFDLPEDLRIAVGRHHDRLEGHEVDNLAVVTIACGIASSLGYQANSQKCVRSLEEVIAAAPPALARHIEPNPEVWKSTLRELVEAG